MRDDIERVLGEMERQDFHEVFCPQCGWLDDYDQDGCCNTCGCVAIGEAVDAEVSLRKHLIAVAWAVAAYVAWIERPRDDKEIESPHAAKGRHLYNVLRAALRALTDSNPTTPVVNKGEPT